MCFIGEFGPYQIKIVCLVCLIGIPVAANNLSQVFFTQPSDHWCAVEEWKDDVDACMDLLTNQKAYLDCLYRYRNSSIPIEETDDGKSYAQCAKFDVDYGVWEASFWAGNATNETIECDEGWVHDSYEYQRTIISDVSALKTIERRRNPARVERMAPEGGGCKGGIYITTVIPVNRFQGNSYFWYVCLVPAICYDRTRNAEKC